MPVATVGYTRVDPQYRSMVNRFLSTYYERAEFRWESPEFHGQGDVFHHLYASQRVRDLAHAFIQGVKEGVELGKDIANGVC